ncbi:MAG: hypothetical protein DDG60_16810 [Anaerolineae bacterium]|nr:MAG: hypothetical protein DDG60_16810 [Anaerolineae bacterium]
MVGGKTMPYTTINNTEIFYETFGTPQTNQAPILLIHGSTQTGRSCWYNVVTRLEKNYFVILPDCRGHGKSGNPHLTYSFKEHAADMATLVRALGFERAHIVGHSNGGNIALVLLMEHPSVVQTCVIQAGNAWVSPDLVKKEPAIFDPQRIEQQRPDWLREMQELHSGLGSDYWRTLVRLTVEEIIREPNYRPEDLAKVTRPVLIVQGEHDMVNAPAKHAQFMAQHIPDSELWIPQGIGHNVHEEVLNEWLKRVTDFWARRGNAISDTLYRYKLAHYRDERDGIFDVRLNVDGTLHGTVLTQAMHTEARNIAGQFQADNIHVLLTPETPWALVNRPVEDVRRGPGILTERVSQLWLGEAVRILETQDDWTRVYVVHDGYTGWVHSRALHACSEDQVRAYQAAGRYIVSAVLAEAHDEQGNLVQKIPFATLLNVKESNETEAWIELPDGRQWRLSACDLTTANRQPNCSATSIEQTLTLMRRLVGVPYLWGGRTPYGFDCSGFSSTFYAYLGITIPRDADQQYMKGEPVEGPLQPGDLVFFGEIEENHLPGPDARGYVRKARITHVAISLGGDEFIHANGTDWGVSYNSFNPQSKIYGQWLAENYRGARRFR